MKISFQFLNAIGLKNCAKIVTLLLDFMIFGFFYIKNSLHTFFQLSLICFLLRKCFVRRSKKMQKDVSSEDKKAFIKFVDCNVPFATLKQIFLSGRVGPFLASEALSAWFFLSFFK